MLITDTHVYFYKRGLHNFVHAPFRYMGITFPTSEHAYMWCKALFFYDESTATKIVDAPTPREAQQLGQQVKNYMDSKWSQVRFAFMYDVCLRKFETNKDLQTLLLSTMNRTIVEASPTDCIWGVGLAQDNPLILDESNWRGTNLLGKVLMTVRDKFQLLDSQ